MELWAFCDPTLGTLEGLVWLVRNEHLTLEQVLNLIRKNDLATFSLYHQTSKAWAWKGILFKADEPCVIEITAIDKYNRCQEALGPFTKAITRLFN